MVNEQKDLTSQQIKVAILTCLENKPNGDSKTNVIGEAYAPVGSIERYFDARLSSQQRHVASKCFDELRSIDFIRPPNTAPIHVYGRWLQHPLIPTGYNSQESHSEEKSVCADAQRRAPTNEDQYGMTKSVELFMWGYQPHFESELESR